MAKRKDLVFYACSLGWAVFVAALTVYLFFPYQKALKLALQNVMGAGRVTVSMEGVTTKPMGVWASRVLLKPDAAGGQAAPFELSNIDIFWNPLSLLTGKLTIHSKASLYGGVLRCVMQGAPLMGPSNPNISLTLDHVNLARCPEGILPWFRGMSGTLDGVIRKETPPGRPDKQAGSFRLYLKGGQVKDLRVNNMPRLIIPYQEITIEGKIDGPRINIVKLALKSDLVSLTGSGFVESGETDQTIDMKLSYETLSQVFPLKGKGLITISGSRKAPVVAIAPQEAAKPAEGPQQAAAAGTAGVRTRPDAR
jgi:type II secretion system protein N